MFLTSNFFNKIWYEDLLPFHTSFHRLNTSMLIFFTSEHNVAVYLNILFLHLS